MKEIKFYHAEWCTPCDAMEPIVDELVDENDVKFDDVDIETDDGREKANEYSVRSIPTIIVFDDDGQVLEQFTGQVEKESIEAVL